jgi:hypothetical protein
VGALVSWYNHEHRHSAIRFVTPVQRNANLDQDILATRLQGSAIRFDGKAAHATGSAYMLCT